MNVSKDDDIFGTSTDTVYTVDPALGPTDANHKYRLFRLLPAMYLRCCFRISVKTSSGATLYWTLDNVAERTKVRLDFLLILMLLYSFFLLSRSPSNPTMEIPPRSGPLRGRSEDLKIYMELSQVLLRSMTRMAGKNMTCKKHE